MISENSRKPLYIVVKKKWFYGALCVNCYNTLMYFPILFLLIIDWIMRQTTKDNNTAIRWKMTTKLDGLHDDIALLSSTKDQMQRKVGNLNRHQMA